MKRVTFVLGGARSGKSRYAEGLARGHKGQPVYIATAEITDDEMRARIDHHKEERGSAWATREAPLDLIAPLREADHRTSFILIDCITVWINNLMYQSKDVAGEVGRLCAELARSKGRVVIVSNEVGLSIVPDNALARAFRDEAGRANQAIAAVADEVVFIAAGLPMVLKKPRPAPRRQASGKSARGRRA